MADHYDNDTDIGDVFAEYDDGQNDDKNAPQAEKKYHTYGGEVKLEHDTVNIKCTACGSSLEFDPDSGKMRCPSCGTTQDIDGDKSYTANDFDPELDVHFNWEGETRMFKCSNCGAETVFDKTEFATECAFCGSPNVAETSELEGIRPDIVLPFKLNAEAAREYYTKWIKKRFFAPAAFKKNLDINQFKGVYSPCWLFDANTHSNYRGVAGKYYYVTVGSGKDQRRERRIRWFPVSGTNSGSYRNVLVEASPHLTQKDIDNLKPFPQEQFVGYDKRYLLGYSADHYDCGLNDSWTTAKGVIDSDINAKVRREILRRADVIQSVSISTNYMDKQYKYGMFPIYVGRVSFKEKIYNMFTNGITGKSTGKYPKSAGKILAVAGLGLVLLAGAVVGALFALGIL